MRTPGQNGSRESGFGTLKYERLFIDEIDDAVMLAKHAEDYRVEYNTIRPHEALAWNRPPDVSQGTADPTIPTLQTDRNPASFLTRDNPPVAGSEEPVPVLLPRALTCDDAQDSSTESPTRCGGTDFDTPGGTSRVGP